MAQSIIVRATRVIGTDVVIYTAYEPSTLAGRHSSITFINGKCYGRIGTSPDSSSYSTLPVGEERTDAVRAAYQAEYERAYAAIVAARPAAAQGKRDSGEIEARADEPRGYQCPQCGGYADSHTCVCYGMVNTTRPDDPYKMGDLFIPGESGTELTVEAWSAERSEQPLCHGAGCGNVGDPYCELHVEQPLAGSGDSFGPAEATVVGHLSIHVSPYMRAMVKAARGVEALTADDIAAIEAAEDRRLEWVGERYQEVAF